MNIEETKIEIASLEAQIKPLAEKLNTLRRQRERLESAAFIAGNKITVDDVEMSSGEGKPWFGNVSSFALWLKANKSTKRFAEWNGVIVFMSDLLNGNLIYTAGYISDLDKQSP